MFAVGDVVRSKRGRDKKRFMIIVSAEDGFVFLCDGKVRKLASPKKKSEKHIEATNINFDMSLVKTDKQLRNVLSEFNK